MRRIAVAVPWSGVDACAGAFGIPGAESRLDATMRRVHRSRCARVLAIDLLAQRGAPEVGEIRRDARGRPRWPAGFTGSLAHVDGYALAATAARGDCASLGVDIEPALPLGEEADLDFLGPAEHRWLEDAVRRDPANALLPFCARSCVHKALDPLRDVALDHADVDIAFDLPAARFTVRARGARAVAALDGLDAQGVVHRVEEHWVLVLALLDVARGGSAGRLG